MIGRGLSMKQTSTTVAPEQIPAWAQDIQPEIATLIRIDDDDFIVFLDKRGEVDWKTSPKFDAKTDAAGAWNSINHVYSRIQYCYSRLPTYLGNYLRQLLSKLLAEALVAALHRDMTLAEKILHEADERVARFSVQASRRVVLLSSGLCFLVALFFLVLLQVCKYLGWAEFYVLHSVAASTFFVGAIGAFLSMVLKNTEFGGDSYIVESTLVYEALFRMLAGAVSGVVVYAFIESRLLPVAVAGDMALYCFAFIGGFMERFVPTLISRNAALPAPQAAAKAGEGKTSVDKAGSSEGAGKGNAAAAPANGAGEPASA